MKYVYHYCAFEQIGSAKAFSDGLIETSSKVLTANDMQHVRERIREAAAFGTSRGFVVVSLTFLHEVP